MDEFLLPTADAEVETVSSDLSETISPPTADAVIQTDEVRKLLYSEHTQTTVKVTAVQTQTESSRAECGVQVGDYVTHGPEPPPGGLCFSDVTDTLAERPDAPLTELMSLLEAKAPSGPLHQPDRRRLMGYLAMAISAETALLNELGRKVTDGRRIGASSQRLGQECARLCDMRRRRILGDSVMSRRQLEPPASDDVEVVDLT